MHHLLRAGEIQFAEAYPGHSSEFRKAALIDGTEGSVHTGLSLCSLGIDGHVDTHLHSYEKSFYILEGEPTLIFDGRAYPLVPGACGLIPLAVPHSWRGPTKETVRWLEMVAPQPRKSGPLPLTGC